MKARVLSKSESSLPCKLTDKEFNDRADKLATTTLEIGAEETKQTDQKKLMKQRLDSLALKQTELADVVAKREELRTVATETTLFEDGRVLTFRMDTNEVISRRNATKEELQITFDVHDEIVERQA